MGSVRRKKFVKISRPFYTAKSLHLALRLVVLTVKGTVVNKFFSFLKKKVEQRRMWISAIKRDKRTPSNYSKFCNDQLSQVRATILSLVAFPRLVFALFCR